MPCYFFSDHLIAHIILPEQKTDFLKYMMLFFCQYRDELSCGLSIESIQQDDYPDNGDDNDCFA